MSNKRPVYEGWASKADEEGGALTGSLTISADLLRFESEPTAIELPLKRLAAEMSSDGGVIFSDEQTGWQIESSDERLLDDYFLQRQYHLRARIRDFRQRREGNRNLKYAVAFLVVVAAIVPAGWLLAKFATNFLTRNVPVSWETEVTEKAIKEHPKVFVFVKDPKREAMLTNLLQRIEAALPEHRYKFQVNILDHFERNAFAMPGGKIFVFKGLLDDLKEPGELAGVLAHEMAHVTQRHGVKRLISAGGPRMALRLFISDRQQLLSVISAGSQLLVTQLYSRDMEREADAIGWHYLLAANIDPRSMVAFLQHHRDATEMAESKNSLAKKLQSHPDDDDRIARLSELWQKSGRKSGFVDLHKELVKP